jgi:hypothetical protein
MKEGDPSKRTRLPGSSELFRDTRADGPKEPVRGPVEIEVTVEELRRIVDALQLARFPELHRVRPTMTQFEELGKLQDRLRKQLGDPPS